MPKRLLFSSRFSFWSPYEETMDAIWYCQRGLSSILTYIFSTLISERQEWRRERARDSHLKGQMAKCNCGANLRSIYLDGSSRWHVCKWGNVPYLMAVMITHYGDFPTCNCWPCNKKAMLIKTYSIGQYFGKSKFDIQLGYIDYGTNEYEATSRQLFGKHACGVLDFDWTAAYLLPLWKRLTRWTNVLFSVHEHRLLTISFLSALVCYHSRLGATQNVWCGYNGQEGG